MILMAGLLGAVMLAVGLAFQSPSKTVPARPDPSGAPPAPVVPEAIRNAHAQRAGVPSAPDAGPFPPERVARFAASEDAQRRFAQDQALKAQGAGILFETTGGPRESDRAPEPSPSSPAAMTLPLSGQGAPGADSDPNLQERKNAFLGGEGTKNTDTLGATLRHPESPYELQAGTILPAVLLTGINSDLPGPVIAHVRENVYDTVSGNFLIVPQGSRLLAHYDSMVAWGQERVLLCWNRLLLPNGDSIDLQCMPAADLAGAAGLTDQVDDHWFRLVKGVAVASLLAATTQAAAGNTVGFTPTVPQVWATNAAGSINQVGQQLARRDLAIQPTITVRPGYAVNVIVTKDMVLPPYVDGSAPTGVGP